MRQKDIIKHLREGSQLWCSHPYTGGKKFTCHVDVGGSYNTVSKRVFFAMLKKGVILKALNESNREYRYILAGEF